MEMFSSRESLLESLHYWQIASIIARNSLDSKSQLRDKPNKRMLSIKTNTDWIRVLPKNVSISNGLSWRLVMIIRGRCPSQIECILWQKNKKWMISLLFKLPELFEPTIWASTKDPRFSQTHWINNVLLSWMYDRCEPDNPFLSLVSSRIVQCSPSEFSSSVFTSYSAGMRIRWHRRYTHHLKVILLWILICILNFGHKSRILHLF